MRRSLALPLALSLLAPLPALTACGPGRDLTPTSSGSGSGGDGGAGAATGSSTTDQGGAGGATTTTTTPEPAGPTRLTIVNGINDYEAIRICFLPYPDGPEVDPWPPSAAGLAFARPKPIDPASIAPAGTDVQPHLIAGDLSAIAGLSCSEALALAASSGGAGGSGGAPPEPPPIVVSPMPILPASVFTAEKSLLLALFGCMGGPGHSDSSEGLGCGFSYSPAAPNASLTLVAMSRKTDPAKIALQIVHASAALQTSDIRLTPGYDNITDVPIASSLALGGLAPKPPFTALARVEFGSLAQASLKTFVPNDIYPTSTVLLQDAFVHGAILDTTFQNGASFTFVALGGYPGVQTQSFWHPFTYTMLPSDPE